MSRCSVLTAFALATACGNGHETPTSEPARVAPAQPAPEVRSPSAPPDGALVQVADASTEVASTTDPVTQKAFEPSASGRRSSPGMRCTLRISPKGIYVDGEPTSRDKALAACKRTAGAIVVLEDNAPADDWQALQTALRRERVPILMRGPVGDNACIENPLAKGCD